MQWWPILGRLHEDAAIIEFPLWHFHIDWRFVDQAMREEAAARTVMLPAKVITTAMIRPIGERGPDPDAAEDGAGALPGAAVERWFRHEIRKTPEIESPEWPAHTMWLGALEARYAKARLGGPNGWTCPHRGADLSGLAHPEEDTVMCPLHGLRWCLRTGELVRRTEG